MERNSARRYRSAKRHSESNSWRECETKGEDGRRDLGVGGCFGGLHSIKKKTVKARSRDDMFRTKGIRAEGIFLISNTSAPHLAELPIDLKLTLLPGGGLLLILRGLLQCASIWYTLNPQIRICKM